MAGLLDFVAGFGVGALGGVAEQKKANLEQKRQLNLAKLKAEYASDIETRKEERAIELRKKLMAAGDFRAAIVAGETEVAKALKTADAPDQTTAMQTEKQRVAYYQELYGMSEQEAARFARLGERDRYAQITGQDNLYYDSVTETFGSFVDNRFVQVNPDTGKFEIPETAPSPSVSEQEESPQVGERGPGRGLGVLSTQIMGSPIPANVISATPGMGSGAKRVITNFSFLGDLYSEYKEFYADDPTNSRSGVTITKENEAKIIFGGYELKVTEFFARDLQEEGRLQSMILDLVKDMKPKAGLFSSQTGVEDKLASIGRLIAPRVADLEEELDPTGQDFYRMSNEERADKRTRLSALSEIYEDTEAMLAANVINNTLVRLPNGENTPVSELKLEEAMEMQNQFNSNPSNFDTRQRTALSYWWGLYNRSRRSAGVK